MRGNRTAPCATCDKVFTSWTSQRRRYCSPACAAIAVRQPIASRLETRVDRSGDHWLWQGKPDAWGYGRLSSNGRVIHAHRAAWEAVAGPIPTGMSICHTCDVRLCVRNDDIGTYVVCGVSYERRGHLFLATRRVNLEDMHAKGRGRGNPTNGSAHHNAKLTEGQVTEIRDLYDAGGISMKQLGQRFNVSRDAVWRIVHGLNWGHVTSPTGTEHGSPLSSRT